MMNRLQIPADLREKIDRELGPEEVIHWIDQPIVRFFTPVTLAMLQLGFSFIVFALWQWGASGFGALLWNASMLAMYFGVQVLLISLYASFMTKKDTLKTAYIITDRRAILFEGHSPMTIRSYLPNQLQNVYRQENKNGSGNVVITFHYVRDNEGGKSKESIGFMDIRDPKGAEKFLRELADINI